MSKVIIREREIYDIDLINSLFSKLTTLKRDRDFYQWIYCIWGEGFGVVAECDGKIIAHYGAVSRDVVIKGETYKSYLGLHAVVDPDYRNSISIFDLTFELYNKLKARNVDFVFGFPNVNYRLIQEKIEKWKRISLFNALELKSKAFDPRKELSEKLDTLNFLYVDLEHFKKESINQSFNYFKRENHYYLRRYINHPQEQYYKWTWNLDGPNRILLIYKIYVKNDEKHCQILEVLGEHTELRECLQELISQLSPFVHFFTFWPISKNIKEILLDIGFTQTSFDTFFGCKALSERAKSLARTDELCNFDNWFLTMGDSDVF